MDLERKFDKHKDVEIVSEEESYSGFLKVKVYNIKHRLFNGGWSEVFKREIVDRGRVAAALPYDPLLDKVILIQQFRIGAYADDYPWLLEIVAGIADGEDKTIEDLIRREIAEESGLTAQSLVKMHDVWVSPGGSTEYLSLYCAKVDASQAGGVFGLKEEHEDIFVHVLGTSEAFDLLDSGKIKNVITIMALQWLKIHKAKIDKAWNGK